MAKKKKVAEEAKGEWIVTYSDMVTLMLCFFVALFNPDESDPTQLQQMISAFNAIGMGASTGGKTITQGKSADLGNTIMSLPSQDRGRNLGAAVRRAMSLFEPEIRSNKVRVTHDERGVIISLASDLFFAPASAEINYEDSREILLRLGSMLNSQELAGRRFRIEGHTDSSDTDPLMWPSNWELSTARSLAVLHYLADIGVDENRFQVAGFAATMPISRDDTPEGRMNNRRVDIVILDDAHL
ncbi:MAG: flagellar motor protein MotB [Spirochaetaceae bacterium]|jgi:chemotaxis protein MotB|nr:flagellar motor protein MotB [Spirochaetaceae bacterium]